MGRFAHDLFRIIGVSQRRRRKYKNLKADPVNGGISNSFGVKSIIFSVFALLMSALIVLAVSIADGASGGGQVFVILFAVLLGIVGVSGALTMVINSFICAIYQMKLNKKSIGWVSLLISFIALIGSVAIVILGLSGM